MKENFLINTGNFDILSDLIPTKTGHVLLWFLFVRVRSEAIPKPGNEVDCDYVATLHSNLQ